MLSQAKSVNEELKKNLAENKQVLERIERIKADELLRGTSNAGSKPVVVEESAQDYAKRIMRGGK